MVLQQRRATTTAAHSSATRKQLCGRVGDLRDMPNMPLDILMEVRTCPEVSWLRMATRRLHTLRAASFLRTLVAHIDRIYLDIFVSSPSRLTEPCAHLKAIPGAPDESRLCGCMANVSETLHLSPCLSGASERARLCEPFVL